MSKGKNQPIGEVACIAKSCERTVPLFRYRERGESEVSVRNRRLSGKLYAVCPDHGRCDAQEYLLEKGHVWDANEKRAAAPANPPAPSTPKTSEKPARAPATDRSSKPPATSPASTPAATPAKPKGWGFYE